MLSHRETLSARADKVLAYLSCNYRLNHHLVLQRALGIDPNLGRVNKCKAPTVGSRQMLHRRTSTRASSKNPSEGPRAQCHREADRFQQ